MKVTLSILVTSYYSLGGFNAFYISVIKD